MNPLKGDPMQSNSSSLQSAFKLLKTSNHQIEILLVGVFVLWANLCYLCSLHHAHFLLQDDKQKVSAMTDISKAKNCGTTIDYELKNVLLKFLIDNITLRKIVSFTVHYALKVSSSTGKDDAEIFAEN
ncbi:hypothetical protein Tco_1369160 [Tanacetum coccineum]